MTIGVFVRCRQCGRNVYLDTNKADLPLVFRITCPFCEHIKNYRRFEAIEERWDFSCPVCSRRFFIRRSPPVTVRCPHCSSVLHISGDGGMTILERGQLPPVGTGIAAGAVIGGLVGAVVAGPIGALLGLMAGGALGAASSVLEATEV